MNSQYWAGEREDCYDLQFWKTQVTKYKKYMKQVFVMKVNIFFHELLIM